MPVEPRRRRWRLIAAVVIALVAAALVLAVRSALTSDVLRTAAEQRLSQTLGQPVTIGALHISFVPRPALTGSGIRIGDERRQAPALDLERVRLVPRLRSLLIRPIVIEEVRLEGLVVSLLRDEAGRWHMPAAAPAPGGGDEQGVRIERVRLQDGRVRLVEERGGQLVETGSLDELEADLAAVGQGLQVTSVTGRVGGAEISGEGRVDPKAARIEISSEAIHDSDLPALLGLAGAERPAWLRLPEPAAVTAAVEIPRDTARLSGHGTIRAPKVQLEPLALEQFDAPFRIEGRRVTFDPTVFSLSGGRHRGAVVVDLAATPPRWAIDSRLESLGLGALVAALTEMGPRIDGRAAGTVDVGGRVGEPLDRTLRGRIRLEVVDGVVRNFPLLAALNRALRLAEGDARDTRFERLAAGFEVAGGQATTRDLTLQAAELRVEARGRLGFDRSVDLAGRAVFSAARSAEAIRSINELAALRNDQGELVLPLTITGTLDDPSFGLDLQAAAGKALTDELRRRLRRILRPPGADEIGVRPFFRFR